MTAGCNWCTVQNAYATSFLCVVDVRNNNVCEGCLYRRAQAVQGFGVAIQRLQVHV